MHSSSPRRGGEAPARSPVPLRAIGVRGASSSPVAFLLVVLLSLLPLFVSPIPVHAAPPVTVIDAVSLQVNASGCASWVRLPLGTAKEDLLSTPTGNGVFSPPLSTSVPSSSLSPLMSVCPSTTGTPVGAVAELSATHWALGYAVTVELSGLLLETRELVVREVPWGVTVDRVALARTLLTDCTPQQLSVYTSTAGGMSSPAALVLCSEDLSVRSINLIYGNAIIIVSASAFATLPAGQQLAQAAVGAAMMAVDEARQAVLFLGTNDPFGATAAGSIVKPRLFTAALAGPPAFNSLELSGVTNVEAMLYAPKFSALLLISTTDVRVVSVACTMGPCGASSSLPANSLTVGWGSGTQTGVPFLFVSSLPAFQSLYAGSARWIEESSTLLLTVRYTDKSVGIVAAVLDYNTASQQYSVSSIRRVGGPLSGTTGVATLPGAMSWPNITGLASPPAIDLFRTGGALTVRGRGFAQPFLQVPSLICILQPRDSSGTTVGPAMQLQANNVITLSNGDAQASCTVPLSSDWATSLPAGASRVELTLQMFSGVSMDGRVPFVPGYSVPVVSAACATPTPLRYSQAIDCNVSLSTSPWGSPLEVSINTNIPGVVASPSSVTFAAWNSAEPAPVPDVKLFTLTTPLPSTRRGNITMQLVVSGSGGSVAPKHNVVPPASLPLQEVSFYSMRFSESSSANVAGSSALTLTSSLSPSTSSYIVTPAVKSPFLVLQTNLQAGESMTLYALGSSSTNTVGFGTPRVTITGSTLNALGDAYVGVGGLSVTPGLNFFRVQTRWLGNYTIQVSYTLPVAELVAAVSNPPRSITAGDVLQLRVAVTADALIASSDLSYAWTSTSHPSLALNSSSVVAGAVNASVLTIGQAQTALWAAGSYTFQVVVADKNPNHRTAAGTQPRAVAQATVQVAAAPERTVVVTEPSANPCVNWTRDGVCKNGGSCRATATGRGAYSLSCDCPTYPAVFSGPTCDFALLGCVNCISRYVGGANVTLIGLGFDRLLSVRVSNHPIALPSSGASLVRSSFAPEVANALAALNQPSLATLQSITFVSPSLVNQTTNSTAIGRRRLLASGVETDSAGDGSSWEEDDSFEPATLLTNPISAYQPLELRLLLPASSEVSVLTYSSLLFYSSSDCIEEGVWRADGFGGCLPCPTGGYCPGGGRVWPLPGYWSWSEYQTPIKCLVSDACPGLDRTLVATGGAQQAIADTQKCSVEYTGPRCAQCSEGYYQLQGRCLYCGDSIDQQRTIALTIVIATSAMVLLALCVALLKARALAYAVQGFILLQELASIGVAGVKEVPKFKDELTSIATYLNMINFDVEILRPGCAGVPTFTYVSKFQYTLVFMLLSCILLLLGCCLRFCLRVRRANRARNRVGPEGAYAPGGEGGKAGKKVDSDSEDEDAHALDEEDDDEEPSKSSLHKAERAALEAEGIGRVARTRAMVRLVMKTAPWTDFKQRVQNSLLILLTIFYLRLTTLMWKAFQCASAPDPLSSTASDAEVTYSLMLMEDMQTVCYTGAHLATVVGVIILLIVYTIGLPVAFFILLTRAFATEHTGGVVGYLRKRFSLLRNTKKRRVRRQSMWAVARGSQMGQPTGQPTSMPSPSLASASLAPTAVSPLASPLASPLSPTHVRLQSSGAAGAEGVPPPSPADTSLRVKSDDPLPEESREPTAAQVQAYRENKFGFLFVGFRDEYFHVSVLLVFVVNAYLATVDVWSSGSQITALFLFGVMWSVQAVLVALYLPFLHWFDNAKKVLIGLATLAHSTLLLGIQTGGSHSAEFFLLLAFFALIILFLLFRQFFVNKLPCLRWARLPESMRKEAERKEDLKRLKSTKSSAGSKKDSESEEGEEGGIKHLRIIPPQPVVDPEVAEREREAQRVKDEEARKELERAAAVRAAMVKQRAAEAAAQDAAANTASAEAAERARLADAQQKANQVSEDTLRVMEQAVVALDAARAAFVRAEHASSDAAAAADAAALSSGDLKDVAALMEAEEARLERDEAALERQAAKDALSLPPTMLQILSVRMSGVSTVFGNTEVHGDKAAAAAANSADRKPPSTEAEWFECLRDAHAEYEQLCKDFLSDHPLPEAEKLLRQASTVIGSDKLAEEEAPAPVSAPASPSASAASAPSSPKSGAAPSPSSSVGVVELRRHVETQLTEWRTVLSQVSVLQSSTQLIGKHMPRTAANLAEIMEQLRASEELTDGATASGAAATCVQQLSAFASFGGALAQMAKEARAIAALWDAAEAAQQAQTDDAELAAALLEHPELVPAGPMEQAMAGLELGGEQSGAAEAVESIAASLATASEAVREEAISTALRSPAVKRGLVALRFAAAALVASRQAAAEAANDDGQRVHLAELLARLTADAAAISSKVDDERRRSETAMLAKLARGRTTKQAKIVQLALMDDALLEAFQLEQQDKQAKEMEAKMKLREQKKAQRAEQRKARAAANVNRMLAAATRAQAFRRLPPLVSSTHMRSSSAANALQLPTQIDAVEAQRRTTLGGSTNASPRVSPRGPRVGRPSLLGEQLPPLTKTPPPPTVDEDAEGMLAPPGALPPLKPRGSKP